MAIEKTLAIVKPDAVAKGVIGKIIDHIETEGLRIVAMKMMHMSREQAGAFYAVHKERPFFGELVDFMTGGPSVVMTLEGEGAILKWRDLMGATDSEKAEAGTIRNLYGTNLQNNASHGSDAPETAAFEIGHFFAGIEVVNSKI
jgi:nucleoside-diphosphate kinase